MSISGLCNYRYAHKANVREQLIGLDCEMCYAARERKKAASHLMKPLGEGWTEYAYGSHLHAPMAAGWSPRQQSTGHSNRGRVSPPKKDVLLDKEIADNEVPEVKKEETLLDLDFDPFKPEVTPAGSAGVTHSPMSQVSVILPEDAKQETSQAAWRCKAGSAEQVEWDPTRWTLPWDLWTTSTDLVQPPDSSESLSLCNLIMEETPDSGLAEEIQRSQNDMGAFTWVPDASTDRVSQETTSGGFGEDSACVSEAERGVRLSTGLLSSADWPPVAEQGEHAPRPALPDGNEQLSPEPVPEAGVAIAACVEMEQPYDPRGSEMPAMDTVGLFKESHEDVKKSGEEEEKEKIEDSLWAGVETCQKVDTGAIDSKTLEGTEEFEEKACERTGNRVVELTTIGKEDNRTLKTNEVETRKDLRAGHKESTKASENYFEKTDLLERDMERGDTAKELSDRDQGLHDGIQKVISDCGMIEGFGAKPTNHPDILNPSLQTYSVSNIEDGSHEGWDLARKDIKENVLDTPNHDMIYYPAQGSADADGIQCETVLNALVGDRDKNQAVLSIKLEVEAQSRTDLSYSLGSDAKGRALCSCKAESSLTEGSERTVTENCSHAVNLPRIAKIGSWETDPGQICQPSLNSAMNNLDITGFSGIPDGQASGFANRLDSINHWPIRDTEGLDNSWKHLDVVEHKEELEVDLLAGVCGEQAIASCWEQSQEIARPLILGTSQNASTEISASPQDQDINNSDLSEDEIANQRYGLLYQEIEADKDEVLTLVCSID
ncbi:hypothetical protein P7K49_024920 [Saguinus oedipus]|uniref:Uncharacterized protein n=1 Tax=Saguinus oedipus TaxID=9490 RepID=A0ABQ9UG68_SAGOE|nr:hypothetical protein P7K49_024920 [Saguinus oedipus]